jgi:predicted dehydrogenase
LDGIARYQSAAEMLAGTPLDYVVISSPPHFHGDQVRGALDRGAFVYLEKPPVPTIHELDALLEHPRSGSLAVGFQFLEAEAFLGLKQKLAGKPEGKIRRICASGLWPRPAWYYRRASWAGRLTFENLPIFDGPLTNAFAHLVHGVFYLAGEDMNSFAAPVSVQGRFLRARPMQASDFGWMWSKTDTGVEVSVMAGHCTRTLVPWKITVHTDEEIFELREHDLPITSRELLVDAHRRTLEACQGKARPRTRLEDCRSYSLPTCGSFVSARGVVDFPASLVAVVGEGSEETYHVEALAEQVDRLHAANFVPSDVPPWLKLGDPLALSGRDAIPANFLLP